MRMVDPPIMCHQYLLGGHDEVHMFGGTIKRRVRMDGYLKANCFEAMTIGTRHEELMKEMTERGYKHKSPLIVDKDALNDLPGHVRDCKIDRDASLDLLLKRCERCRSRYEEKNIYTLIPDIMTDYYI